ncbi:MAG: TIGR03067 domain-containing protein [Verrucomicrobia bacterium]|nr:TIGR03067 domain-containing protein [Verrucomicrobiota bacterium]
MTSVTRVRRCLGAAVQLALLAAAVVAAEPISPWRLIFAFGDSYTDSGAGYVDGDGPTAIVYVARDLGVPFTHATAPDAAGKGLNFAVSGAQTGEGEGRRIKDALLGRGMQNQGRDFAARVQSGAVKFEPERTLFFVAGGLNDGRLTTETTMANLTLLVRQLHAVGARHFLIAVLPQKIPQFARVGQRLSPALAQLPVSLKEQYPAATFHVSRWGDYMDAVMAEPARFGITNTTDACAGRALFDQDTTPRGDPKTYFFYHEGHPSTAVQRIVAHELRREVLAAAPVAGLAALNGTWKPTAAELAGQPMPPPVLKTITLKLDGAAYEVVVETPKGPAVDRGAVTIDLATKPASMTIAGIEGPNAGKAFPAIYEIAGDTLRICYDLAGKARPTEFKTRPETKQYWVTYQRAK